MTPPHTSSFITGFRHDNSYKATLSPSTITQQPQKPDGCQNDDGQNQPMITNNQPNKNTKNTNCNRHNARSFYPLLGTSTSISYTIFTPPALRCPCDKQAAIQKLARPWAWIPQVYTYAPFRCTPASLSGVHLWAS